LNEAINEDYALADSVAGIFAVADGLGGRPAGDQASRTAIESFAGIIRALPIKTRLNRTVLENAVIAANKAVRRLADLDPLFSGSGTTLSAVVLHGRIGRIVHVGDSRIYLYRRSCLRRLTRDHNLASELAGQGHMNRPDALRSRWQHMLTRCLGTRSRVTPDITIIRLLPGDLLLLLTDGVTGSLGEDQIRVLLKDKQGAHPVALCHEIMDKALHSSPRDNLTVVIVRLRSSCQ
jgi:protein phosphatase